MLCVCISGPTFQDAFNQISQAKSYCEGFEFRLDRFQFHDLESISHLMKLSHLPVIFTYRKKSQGGFCQKSETERIEYLKSLLALKPDYVDLEWDVEPKFFHFFQQYSKVICSYHNFKETPINLSQIENEMKKNEAIYYKIACFARSSIDTLNILSWMKQKPKERIGIAMGEKGIPSRILGPYFGSPVTYFSVDSMSCVSPGQMTILIFRLLYDVTNNDREISCYGLIGSPIDQSPSHISHNLVFRALDMPAMYVKWQVEKKELNHFLEKAIHLGFKGFSVTMPLKEAIIPFVFEMDESKIGAVNTLRWEGKFFGKNTDGIGALNAIEEIELINGKKMVILGAGGSAKAIAYEGKKRGAEIVIINRTKKRAIELAERIGGQAGSIDEFKSIASKGYDVLINATSSRIEEKNLFISPNCLLPHKLVLDVSLKPMMTPFVQEALRKNCRVLNGRSLFIHQAVEQFAYWFGPQIDNTKVLNLLDTYVKSVD